MKKRILCVSDHEDTSVILALMLRRRGYEVVVAPSLVTALLVSCGQSFSLYVLDAQLRGHSGTELCRSIRECDPLAPVLVFSSAPEESARREAFEAGATLFILKPDICSLVEAVRHASCELSPSPRTLQEVRAVQMFCTVTRGRTA